MSTTVGSGSFLDVLKYYNTHAAPGNKTQYIKDNGADAATLKDTLRSLGFDQPKLSDAVEAFQRQYNAQHADTPIAVDGKAGANTLEALYSSADTLRQNCGSDTAKFLDAKSQITPFVGPPRPDSLKVTSHDPKTIKEQLNQKLDENQAKAPAAAEPKVDAGTVDQIRSLKQQIADIGHTNGRETAHFTKARLQEELTKLTAENPGAANSDRIRELKQQIADIGHPNSRQPEFYQKQTAEAELAKLTAANPAAAGNDRIRELKQQIADIGSTNSHQPEHYKKMQAQAELDKLLAAPAPKETPKETPKQEAPAATPVVLQA